MNASRRSYDGNTLSFGHNWRVADACAAECPPACCHDRVPRLLCHSLRCASVAAAITPRATMRRPASLAARCAPPCGEVAVGVVVSNANEKNSADEESCFDAGGMALLVDKKAAVWRSEYDWGSAADG